MYLYSVPYDGRIEGPKSFVEKKIINELIFFGCCVFVDWFANNRLTHTNKLCEQNSD